MTLIMFLLNMSISDGTCNLISFARACEKSPQDSSGRSWIKRKFIFFLVLTKVFIGI